MKQFYSNHWSLRFKRSLLLLASFLGAISISLGQVYTTSLSGPAEAPPNASPGTGFAKVTITGNFMRVQANFTGLMGPTTASHIHAATAVPGAGTAGVATTLPSFPGFPLGVTSGTMDNSFDMTLASSYNPAYITNNGGTPASAFAALKTAMDNGRAYFNVHSTSFPGGEIRGFLQLCPTINVTIPDAFALPQGTVANTVYPAYAPASSLTLTTNVSGGTGPYSYSWSNGASASSTTVSPTVTTVYTVTVTDSKGCPGTASKTVNVMDISSGNKGNKIEVCHKNGNTLSIASPAVAAHIGHGDLLGSCNGARMISEPGVEIQDAITIRTFSNPSHNYFQLQLNGKAGTKLELRVYDVQGRMIESRSSLLANQTLRIGGLYNPGIYLVEIIQGTQKQTLKLIKSE